MVTDGGSQMQAETAERGPVAPVVPRRVTDDDGHLVDVFPLPTDEGTLKRLLRELFESHWDKIVFGPIIVFPHPFLSPDGKKVLSQPDWSRLALWDEMRFRYAGVRGPDPVDRSGTGFRHD